MDRSTIGGRLFGFGPCKLQRFIQVGLLPLVAIACTKADPKITLIGSSNGNASFTLKGVSGGTDTLVDAWYTNTLGPMITWGESSSAVTYQLEIQDTLAAIVPNCGPVTLKAPMGSYTFPGACTLAAAQTYSVVLSATDSKGKKAYAPSFSFTVDNTAPTNAGPVSPTSGTYGIGSTIPVTWPDFTDTNLAANSGRLEFSTDGGSTWSLVTSFLPIASGAGNNHTWSPPIGIEANVMLRVKGYDLAGNFFWISNGAGVTIDTVAPTLSLIGGPAAGATLLGGGILSIDWSAVDTNFTGVSLEYTTDGGTSWTLISSGLPAASSYFWNMPGVDSTSVQVRLNAQDVAGNTTTVVTNTFSIDASPPTLSTSWTPPAFAKGGDVLNITWTPSTDTPFSLPANPIKIEYSLDAAATWNTAVGATANSGSYSWTVPALDTALNDARIKVTATDGAGRAASVQSAFFTFDSTAPSLSSLGLPNGSGVIAGGNVSVTWTGADSNFGGTPFQLELSTDGGSTYGIISSSIVSSPYVWAVPHQHAPNSMLRLTATDLAGNSATLNMPVQIMALIVTEYPGYDFGKKVLGSTTKKILKVQALDPSITFGNISALAGSGLSAPFEFEGGSFPGAQGTCGTTLGYAGSGTESCFLVLSYSPSSTGVTNQTLNLSFTFNAVPANTISLNLKGDAYMPFSPSQLRTLTGDESPMGFSDSPARFNYPEGVAVDWSSGYIYVSDTSNHTIRKFDGATWTTLAGSPGLVGSTDGTGAAARFNMPRSIVFVGGYLYVADFWNHTIRKIDVVTGVVTTFAGLAGNQGYGSACGLGGLAGMRFNFIRGLATDGNYLYVTDDSFTLRRIDLMTTQQQTVAGLNGSAASVGGSCGTSRLTGPMSIAYDGLNGIIIFDSGPPHKVRKFDIGGQTLTGVGTDLVTSFGAYIWGIAENAGNLYFTTDHGIQVCATGGCTPSWYAGGGTAGFIDATGTSASFSSPAGITVDFSGNLIVADKVNQRIREINTVTADVTTIAGYSGLPGYNLASNLGARFSFASAIALDGSTAYITDAANNIIRDVSFDSPSWSTTNSANALRAGMPLSAPGYVDSLTATAAKFNVPVSLAFDGQAVYVADAANCVIRRLDKGSGEVTTLAGTTCGYLNGAAASAQFSNPEGLCLDGQTLYVADTGNNVVRAIDLPSKSVWTLMGIQGSSGSTDGGSGTAQFQMPKSLACDGSNVYVADIAAGRIRRINLLPIAAPTTTTLGGAAGMGFMDGSSASARFNMPTGLALDGSALYVADKNNNAIRSIDLTFGMTSTVVGKPWLEQNLDAGAAISANGAFFNPTGLFFSGDAILVTTPVSVRVMY